MRGKLRAEAEIHGTRILFVSKYTYIPATSKHGFTKNHNIGSNISDMYAPANHEGGGHLRLGGKILKPSHREQGTADR